MVGEYPLENDIEKQKLPLAQEKGTSSSSEDVVGAPVASGQSTLEEETRSQNGKQAEDYDERAANFWSVYVTEAESHDKALIETWKEDMEGIIIFAGLYSASLTAFLVESYQNLESDPAAQTVTLMQQSILLLSQISRQLNGTQSNLQFPVPDIALPGPAASDVRINIYWFMSLVFSLTAALFATIVQQWVRDYMHVFQRYNHSLKRARIRQFLYEGANFWRMSVIVDAIPALIHISLFLFFVGLCEFLFGLNDSVAIWTTTVISLSAALYIWTMFAPILDAQSPYQSPASGVFWYIFQTFLRGRRYKDHHGKETPVSTDMTEGRVQIAMDESHERKERDARAIRWVIDNLTEDSELEPFVLGIPGSLNSAWGKSVWSMIAEQQATSTEVVPRDRHPWNLLLSRFVIRDPAHGIDAVGDLSGRITRLLKTCTDSAILSEELRKKRARACIDAALHLVLSLDGKWQWFAEDEIMSQALVYLGNAEKMLEMPPPPTFDGAFGVRWVCMTVMVVQHMIQDPSVQTAARNVVARLADVRKDSNSNVDEAASRTTWIIDRETAGAWSASKILRQAFEAETGTENMDAFVQQVLNDQKGTLADLEYVWNILGWAREIDEAVITLTQVLHQATGGVLTYLPGFLTQWPDDGARQRKQPSKGMRLTPQWLIPQLLPPLFLVQRLWLDAWTARNINVHGWTSSWNTLKNPTEISAPETKLPRVQRIMDDTPTPFQTQLWRMADIRDGGMIFSLEVLMGAIRDRKLSRQDSSRRLIIDTLKAVTTKWQEHRSFGTQKLLVALLRDVVPTDELADNLPTQIVDEVLKLAGKMLEGEKGAHVDEALKIVRGYHVHTHEGIECTVAREVAEKIYPRFDWDKVQDKDSITSGS
ncbi:hypothetical protein OF83DRAFT_1286945 [Amylostereum chailletii]|nr:hypothetical protein OF83DRAFT_1286945 [Amylostereum chailletii]